MASHPKKQDVDYRFGPFYRLILLALKPLSSQYQGFKEQSLLSPVVNCIDLQDMIHSFVGGTTTSLVVKIKLNNYC